MQVKYKPVTKGPQPFQHLRTFIDVRKTSTISQIYYLFINWKRKFIIIHSTQFSVSNYFRLIQLHNNQQTLTKFGGSLRYLVK